MSSQAAVDTIYFDLADNEIYFNTEKEIRISDLIESLKGLERLVRQSNSAFTHLLGAKVSKVEVYVEQLEAGSLKERILLRLFFEDEEQLDVFLAKWRGKIRELGPMKGAGIAAGVVIAGLVGYGMFLSATRPGPTQQTTIDFSESNIVIVGAEAFETSPDSFRMAIESAAGDRKALARESLRFIEPARNAGGDIQFDGLADAVIDEQSIRAAPLQAVNDPDEINEPHRDIDLQIRATDIDSYTSGWAGVIPGLVERRLPLEIAESVDMQDMVMNSTVRADVTIVKKFDARMSGDKYRPYKIIVERLVHPEEIE